MKALEEKILKEGTVKDGGILKVDNFLNLSLWKWAAKSKDFIQTAVSLKF